MAIIRLLDARRGLYRKCEELFGDAKIAEAIYRFLCNGIDDCEDVAHERKKGKWIKMSDMGGIYWTCSECGEDIPRVSHFDPQFDLFPRLESIDKTNFCPNCGAEMSKGETDE